MRLSFLRAASENVPPSEVPVAPGLGSIAPGSGYTSYFASVKRIPSGWTIAITSITFIKAW
jgi:hypothetical protein